MRMIHPAKHVHQLGGVHGMGGEVASTIHLADRLPSISCYRTNLLLQLKSIPTTMASMMASTSLNAKTTLVQGSGVQRKQNVRYGHSLGVSTCATCRCDVIFLKFCRRAVTITAKATPRHGVPEGESAITHLECALEGDK
eukprot:4423717-Pyramimonas_sp.AAC.3